MDAIRGPSSMGASQMAIQAKEVRNLLPSAKVSSAATSGNEKPEGGNSLPAAAEQARANHDVGLQRAIERLQQNSEKNPEAQGLQQALEKLQARSITTIETSA